MKKLVAIAAAAVTALAALPALAGPPPPKTHVSGTIRFEDALQDRTSQGFRPVRSVKVTFRDKADVVGTAVTNAMGHFDVDIETSKLFSGHNFSMTFYAENSVATVNLDTDGIDDVFAYVKNMQLKDVVKPIVFDYDVPITGFSQHLSILDALMVAHDYAADRMESDDEIFSAQVQYPDSDYTHSNDNVFSDDCITVHGPAAYGYGSTDPMDPYADDGFDDGTILHEYGHILEYQVSSIDSPGGPHDEDCVYKSDGFSWSEAWATYFAMAVWDHDPAPLRGTFFAPEGVTFCGTANEEKVLHTLWDLHDEVGTLGDSFDRVDGRAPDAAGRPAHDLFFRIFDIEMEDQVEPTVYGFHDALVARLASEPLFLHADIDRVFRDNGINPHRLSNYAVVSIAPVVPIVTYTTGNRFEIAFTNDGDDLYEDEDLSYTVSLTPVGGGPTIELTSPLHEHFSTPPGKTSVDLPGFEVDADIPAGDYTLSVVVDPLDRLPRPAAGAPPSRIDVTVPVETCGNGICQRPLGETCDSCEADCGACMGCGDGFCIAPESPATCSFDCGVIIGP